VCSQGEDRDTGEAPGAAGRIFLLTALSPIVRETIDRILDGERNCPPARQDPAGRGHRTKFVPAGGESRESGG